VTRFLLDTHIWLWAAFEPHKLTSEVRNLLNSPGTDFMPNHKDPADRFLAATAIDFDLILVTSDQKLMDVPGLKVLANV